MTSSVLRNSAVAFALFAAGTAALLAQPPAATPQPPGAQPPTKSDANYVPQVWRAKQILGMKVNIANNKNTLQLADFPNPKYGVKVDFTDAGAGSYSSTLVVEYLLAP